MKITLNPYPINNCTAMNRGTRKPIPLSRLVIASGIIVFACAALAIAPLLLRPRSFASFPEAIGYELEQRGIAYQNVFIDRSWPDTVNDITYGANLVITMNDAEDIVGRLDCRGWQRDCVFTIRSFGIYREPLPELAQRRTLPWVEWLERIGIPT